MLQFLTLGTDRFEVGKCAQVCFDAQLRDLPIAVIEQSKTVFLII